MFLKNVLFSFYAALIDVLSSSLSTHRGARTALVEETCRGASEIFVGG